MLNYFINILFTSVITANGKSLIMQEQDNTIYIYSDKNAVAQMRFPQKLWYLLKLRTDAILWGGTGRTILLNYKVLGEYLQCDHSIFKTTNISSFVRQLNLYGFKKVTSHLLDPICNSSNPYMHEYVHEYFQYSRPELLNNINRKAFAMKRSYRTKMFQDDLIQTPFSSPLQRARYALKIALNKAAHNLYRLDSSRTASSFNFECQEMNEDFCEQDEQDNIEFDWTSLPDQHSQTQDTEEIDQNDNAEKPAEVKQEIDVFREPAPSINQIDVQIDDETPQTSNDNNVPERFLHMPDLDVEANAHNNELLSEFDLNGDSQVISKRVEVCTSSQDSNSMNCVLPSIGHIDDVSIADKSACLSSYYSGEWEQMFNDIITNKGSNQEYTSDVREFYSQISKTIDVLNS